MTLSLCLCLSLSLYYYYYYYYCYYIMLYYVMFLILLHYFFFHPAWVDESVDLEQRAYFLYCIVMFCIGMSLDKLKHVLRLSWSRSFTWAKMVLYCIWCSVLIIGFFPQQIRHIRESRRLCREEGQKKMAQENVRRRFVYKFLQILLLQVLAFTFF
jgi:hypothetical protein